MLRNRIHALLDRQRGLELPVCSDLFGAKGLGFLRKLELPEPDGTLLAEQLALHDLIATQMRAQEKRIAAEFGREATRERLREPARCRADARCRAGRGDRPDRALSECRQALCLRGRRAHDPQLRRQDLARPTAALVQQMAALGAHRSELGRHRLLALLWRHLPAHRQRGKKANTGILIVARRMCRIVWHLPSEQRDFEQRPSAAQTNPVPGCSGLKLTASSETK